jgi:hypothetical protein
MLASADPATKPIVDPAYFADETDLEVLVAGVRMAREIAACPPLARITAGEIAPGEDLDDDERVRDWIRATAGTMFHPTGTCAMGGSAEAVCDPELRVRGLEGLRVVDASVMPATPRGNTVAQSAVLDQRGAVDGPEGAAEVPGAGQAPTGRDGAHRHGRGRRIQQVTAAPLQPALPDQPGDARLLPLEQFVQGAKRGMVGAGDGRRGELGIGQLALDEGAHAQEQRPLGDVRWHLAVAVQPAGEGHREEVERGRAHPGPAGRVEVVELAGRPGEEGAGAVVTGHADGGQLGGVIGAQREKLAREGDGHDPGRPRVRPVGGAGESTKAKSPAWRRACRPSWSTTTSPRATTSTLQRSASIIWMCRRRSAPPGLDADNSPTRTTPRSVARTWSGGSLPPPDRTSSGPKAALTTSWTYSERAAAGTSSARSTTVMAIS